ncbi:hypothetical protein VNO80_21765 [Phaseolus coccineus]|uniref:Secreted protein n=1 Tax=Phaseolus coccineus TaxID=3886 RepID=A0AAN9QY09_PHACN
MMLLSSHQSPFIAIEFVFVLFCVVKSSSCCCTSVQSWIPNLGVIVRLSTPTYNHTIRSCSLHTFFIYLYLVPTLSVGALLQARKLTLDF